MDAGPTLPALLLETYNDSHPTHPPPDLSTKQSTEYLTRLTGYSLNSLTSEPSRIADEHAFVGRELTSLCIGEYKSFVAVHQCKEHVRGALAEFDASLEELRRAIPELERECAAFVQETSGIQADRRRAQIVLEHQDKLVDLLDIPQLVDTCVRNGYYHEAMELTSHTRQLVDRHPDVPLVKAISTQVDSIMQLQLSQLVASLREPVKLPVLVKSIGFLRKMGSLEEDELRLAFLESRAQRWRDHVREHVDKERHDPTRYVRRYVDAFRELQYDTVVQYTAIFLDPAPFRNQSRRGATPGMDDASRVQALDLVVRYAHHAVADLLHCITTYIPAITDPSSLSSLLTQLGYTALSFSRVGIDFSAYLPDVFERAVHELTVSSWDEGLQQVVERLRPTSTAQRTASPSGQSDIEAVFLPGFLVSPAGLAALTRAEPPAFIPPVHKLPDSKTVPPLYLTSYPLLATYTNALITTLNSLRLLAPAALFPALYAALLGNLAAFGTALLEYAIHATGQSSDNAALAPARKRPEGLRRNTSISNRDQLAERTQARERHGKRILCAVLDAFARGCVPFLKGALVDGVYAAQGVRGGRAARSEEQLEAVLGGMRDWVARHAEVGERKVEPKGITEEDVPAESRVKDTDVPEKEDSKPLTAEPVAEPVASTTIEETRVDETEGYSVDAQTPTLQQAESEIKVEPPASQQPTVTQDEVTLPIESTPLPTDEVPETPAPIAADVAEETQQSSTPQVIEQVLEIGIENHDTPVAFEEAADPSSMQAVPVQITEEVQIPVQDSALPSLESAAPVPVVSDTSTARPSTEEQVTATPKAGDDIDIVDRLIAAKEEAEAVSERIGADEASQNGKGTEDASLPTAEIDQNAETERSNDSVAPKVPTSIESEVIPGGRSEEPDITRDTPEPQDLAAAPLVSTADSAQEPTVPASVVGPETTVSHPYEDAPGPLDEGEEDVPSGMATPENEDEKVESEPIPPALETDGNPDKAAVSKSKKKKNKKKAKK